MVQSENPQREARLAAALRENLKKRKAQARARDESNSPPEPGEHKTGNSPGTVLLEIAAPLR